MLCSSHCKSGSIVAGMQETISNYHTPRCCFNYLQIEMGSFGGTEKSQWCWSGGWDVLITGWGGGTRALGTHCPRYFKKVGHAWKIFAYIGMFDKISTLNTTILFAMASHNWWNSFWTSPKVKCFRHITVSGNTQDRRRRFANNWKRKITFKNKKCFH